MALLDEEIVEYWLNHKGFFCMRGVKSGLGEIDFLCVKPRIEAFDAWHVEVQVSFRPIGYIGGDTNARRRSDQEIATGIDQWIVKKFTDQRKTSRRNKICPNADWQYVLVCAEIREPLELDLLRDRGIKVLRYSEIIAELLDDAKPSNSSAGNIIEILRYSARQVPSKI